MNDFEQDPIYQETLKVQFSRPLAWLNMILMPLLPPFAIFAAVAPTEMALQFSSRKSSDTLAWLLFGWMPPWVIFGLSIWLSTAMALQCVRAFGHVRSACEVLSFDEQGLTYRARWRPKRLLWAEIKRVRISQKYLRIDVDPGVEPELTRRFRMFFRYRVIPHFTYGELRSAFPKIIAFLEETKPYKLVLA